MLILRLVVMTLTGVLSIVGLILAVVALLAAQWLAVAVVMVVLMGVLWAAVRVVRFIAGSGGAEPSSPRCGPRRVFHAPLGKPGPSGRPRLSLSRADMGAPGFGARLAAGLHSYPGRGSSRGRRVP
jgi:hypothetical protein